MNMTNRMAALLARHDEELLKSRGEVYSDAVIQACNMYLNQLDLETRSWIEMSLPKENLL